jgi:hypothetical protein
LYVETYSGFVAGTPQFKTIVVVVGVAVNDVGTPGVGIEVDAVTDSNDDVPLDEAAATRYVYDVSGVRPVTVYVKSDDEIEAISTLETLYILYEETDSG